MTAWPPGIPFVDLSSFQAPAHVDWEQIRASGITTAYLRATEGIDRDSAYEEHRDRATDAGVAIGAYAFWRPRHAAQELVDVFLDAIGCDGNLPPVIDLEAEAPQDLLTPEALEAHVDEGLQLLGRAFRTEPMLYAGPGFVAAHLPSAHGLGRFPLWCAAYLPHLLLPRGWTKAIAWQFSGTGSVKGYPGSADVSVWQCTEAELQALTMG